MAVTIALASTQNLGMTRSPKGDIPYWRVTFQLDGAEFLSAPISIAVKGPTTPRIELVSRAMEPFISYWWSSAAQR